MSTSEYSGVSSVKWRQIVKFLASVHCLVPHLSAGSAAQTAPVKSSSSAPANLSPLGAGSRGLWTGPGVTCWSSHGRWSGRGCLPIDVSLSEHLSWQWSNSQEEALWCNYGMMEDYFDAGLVWCKSSVVQVLSCASLVLCKSCVVQVFFSVSLVWCKSSVV